MFFSRCDALTRKSYRTKSISMGVSRCCPFLSVLHLSTHLLSISSESDTKFSPVWWLIIEYWIKTSKSFNPQKSFMYLLFTLTPNKSFRKLLSLSPSITSEFKSLHRSKNVFFPIVRGICRVIVATLGPFHQP